MSLIPDTANCLDGYAAPSLGEARLPFDPFDDIASRYYPTTLREAWRLCEFFFLTNQTYRKGSERMVDYFINKLKSKGESDEDGKDLIDNLHNETRIMSQVRQVGINYMCYTNAVVSLVLPFARQLVCKNESCRAAMSINALGVEKLEVDQKTGVVKIPCPKCRRTGFELRDSPIRDYTKVNFKVWDPKRVTIERNTITNEKRFWFDIPAHERNRVLAGDAFLLSTMPMSVLRAIWDNKRLLLSNRLTFHFGDAEIAGVDLGGWSPPVTLSAFRNLFRLLILNRHDEAIAADYVVPMRMLSPAPTTGDSNTFMMQNMVEVIENMESIVRRHQVDGLDWYMTPIPMLYNLVGGEAKSLAPKELIEAEEDRLLNGRGIPPELYRASMTIQAAPIALRLFERSNIPLVEGIDNMLYWSSKILSTFFGKGDQELEMEKSRILDDIDHTHWRMHAHAAGLLSKETAMAPHEIDPAEERDKILQEQEDDAIAAEEAERRQMARQMSLVAADEEEHPDSAAAGPGGGAHAPGGTTPSDIQAEARRIAEELYHPSVDQATRHRELRAIAQQNELLHAAVMEEGRKIKREGASIAQADGVAHVIEERQQ